MSYPKILIAEDDSGSALVLSKILKRAGFEDLLRVKSGDEALEAMRHERSDILISDIAMPGNLDGIEAAREIMSLYDIPVVLVSGFSDRDTIERAKTIRPAAYLLKPFRMNEVTIAVEMALHKAESDKRLKESQQRSTLLATTLENISDGVVITDADDQHPTIRYVNRAFTRITGFAFDDIVGKPVTDISGPDDTDRQLAEACQSLKNGPDRKWECRNYRANKTVFRVVWKASHAFVQPRGVDHFVFTLTDVTEVRSFEEQYRHSQKIEAIGRFTGGIAHDFNNLLAVINSYSDLLKLKLGQEHPHLRYVENIRSAGQRGTDLVAQLLTFARQRSEPPQSIQLKEVIDGIYTMIRRLIRENVHVSTDCQQGTPDILASSSHIEQILINLCMNAHDAIEESGHIEISCYGRCVKETDGTIENPPPPGQWAVMCVRDDGCGISEEIREKIFEPFFTTKDVGKGTGLGLSTIYGLVKQHDGHIRLESKTGEGTCFEIYLPANLDAESSSNQSDRQSENKSLNPSWRGRERILIVEDDPTIRESIITVLDDYGYVVETCRDAETALEEWLPRAQQFDLMLTDIVLPNLSGRELAIRFARENPQLAILLMTGYVDEPLADHRVGRRLLKKPFNIQGLLEAIRESLDEPPAKATSENPSPESQIDWRI